jgi:gamma-glutamyltranspeptidase/glutathione hydrolase
MFESRFKNCQVGKKGMVAAAHPLAAMAGLKALWSGGNAMDACLTMASVTSVVLPHMCGLGGDAFLIYYDAATGDTVALNGSGIPGDDSTLERFAGQGEILPQHGIHSVAVPGAPLVYDLACRRFGTFSLAQCFEAGAKIAEEGFVVSDRFEKAVYAGKNKLSQCEETFRVFLPGGNPPRAGTLFRQEDLARTLREFGAQGAGYFYKGAFAEKFYEMSRRMGGTFLGGEFARHLEDSPGWYEPIRTDYRNYTVLETAPVSAGFMVLEQMNLLEHFDVEKLDPKSADSTDLMVRIKKVAFSDRNTFAGDPAVSGFDVSRFISEEYAREAVGRIQDGTQYMMSQGNPAEGDTTSFVAWDEAGNCCSFIQSIAFSFGSGVVVPGTGVILNNRAGRSFNMIPGHPNCLEPGKRPMHTLNCYMVLEEGVPFIVGGTPGGDGQPQWNMQMLSLMLDHRAGPQEAADFPRWISTPGTDMIALKQPPKLTLESRFPVDTIARLADMGHDVHVVGPYSGGGGAQIIMKDQETGALLAGSDSRIGGVALGF